MVARFILMEYITKTPISQEIFQKKVYITPVWVK